MNIFGCIKNVELLRPVGGLPAIVSLLSSVIMLIRNGSFGMSLFLSAFLIVDVVIGFEYEDRTAYAKRSECQSICPSHHSVSKTT
jgi:hypothetical protein